MCPQIDRKKFIEEIDRIIFGYDMWEKWSKAKELAKKLREIGVDIICDECCRCKIYYDGYEFDLCDLEDEDE